jgi:hypothetical protein
MREATRLSMIVSMPDAGGASTASRAWLFGTYGHLVDANLWQAARFVGAPGHLRHPKEAFERMTGQR